MKTYTYIMEAGPNMVGFWPRAEINRHFRIKFYGTLSDGTHVNKLVGVKGLVAELGEDLSSKLVSSAFQSSDDKFNRKLRRGLQVTFYVQ